MDHEPLQSERRFRINNVYQWSCFFQDCKWTRAYVTSCWNHSNYYTYILI